MHFRFKTPKPTVCGTLVTGSQNNVAAPVVHQVPKDCNVVYAQCEFVNPGETAVMSLCRDADLNNCVSTFGTRSVAFLFTCNAMTKLWDHDFYKGIKSLYCGVQPGGVAASICPDPPNVSGSPMPLLTAIPYPGTTYQYIVTCAFPKGTIAAMDLYLNGAVFKTISRSSDNAVSIQAECSGTMWRQRGEPSQFTDIKCRAI
uniref:Uncharacterized protein n=1 Tax=Panagrolaimus davidi TaxID=227884 RepID=A0A914QHA0_9BILA